MRSFQKLAFVGLLFGIVLGPVSVGAFGDTLHAFCYGATAACLDNGTITPTGTNPPNFGFTISPGPRTGNYYVDILAPNNEVAAPGSLSFDITGTQGGSTNDQSLSATATLYSASAWTGNDLASYLGIGASPSNPIGAFLPSTKAVDSGATGYFVYVANLGVNRLQANPDALSGPLLNIGSPLPTGSLIVGFLDTGTALQPNYGATANSGALFESGATSVPEPNSLLLIGIAIGGLAGKAWIARRA